MSVVFLSRSIISSSAALHGWEVMDQYKPWDDLMGIQTGRAVKAWNNVGKNRDIVDEERRDPEGLSHDLKAVRAVSARERPRARDYDKSESLISKGT